MKTNAIKILSVGVFLTALMFIGCKKGETGPAGAAGPAGPQGPVLTLNNGGFVSGNLTGTRRDGTPINEPFNYTYYYPGSFGAGSIDSISSNLYSFQVQRLPNDIWGNNSSYLNIQTTSKTASTGSLSLSLNLEKLLSTNQLFTFSAYSATAIATSLSYNASTGLFSGNYNISLTGSQNNTGNPAVISGSFQANVIQKVYKIKEKPEINNF